MSPTSHVVKGSSATYEFTNEVIGVILEALEAIKLLDWDFGFRNMFTYLCDIVLYYDKPELRAFNMEGRLLRWLKTFTNVL
jgi:hypothetical protein